MKEGVAKSTQGRQEEIKVGHSNLRQTGQVKFREEKGGVEERGRKQTHNGLR